MKYLLLKENIQKARKVLKEVDIDESNERFIEIKNLLKKHSGYLGLFTYLYFKKKVNIEKLSNLLDNLIQNKSILGSLPKQVVKYEDIEKLEDDINTAKEWSIYNREFVRNLTSILKINARNDTDLKNAYIHLKDDSKKDLLSNFIPKVSRYKNYEDFKTDCIYYMDRNKEDINDVIENIKKTKGAYLIYNKDNILISEIYTKNASCSLGSKSWCISGDIGLFWESYAGIGTGNKQYFIWNFSVSPSNVESQVGVTINRSGGARATHLKDDSPTSIHKYLEKYNIPNILNPMDYRKDIPKILDSVGFNKDVMEILQNNDLIDQYINIIPYNYRKTHGYLTDDEVKDMDIFKKYVYTNGNRYTDQVSNIFSFCNRVKRQRGDEYVEEYIKENSDSEYIQGIDNLNFMEKLILIRKYQKIVTHELDNYGCDVFFYKEKKEMEDTYPLEISKNGRTFDFEFEKIDMDDYCSNILNLDTYVYSDLEQLNNPYGYNILDNIDSDEFNYIHNYLTTESKNKLIEYLNYMKELNPHKGIVDRLNIFISNIETGSNSIDSRFIELFEFISKHVDENFSDPYSYNSYFEGFWDRIIESARDYMDEDAHIFTESLKGYYDDRKDTWEIDIYEILDLISKDEYWINNKNDLSISKWMENHPNDLSIMKTNFYDVPHANDYLNLANTDSANEDLIEELDEVLDGSSSKFDTDYYNDMKVYIEYLNNKFDTIIDENNIKRWRIENRTWLGYYGTIGKDEIIIPYTEIYDNGTMNAYKINKKELLDNGEINYSILKESNIKKLTDMGIILMEVDINSLMENDTMKDSNQMEFKFEKLRTFKGFLKNNIN